LRRDDLLGEPLYAPSGSVLPVQPALVGQEVVRMPIEEPNPSSVTMTSAASEPAPPPVAGPDVIHAAAVALDSSPRRLTLLALAAGVLSGLVAWLVWEAVSGYFAPRGEVVMILGTAQTIVTFDGRVRAGVRGGAVAAAILGAAMGLALGLAGGLARRTTRAGLFAGLAGAVLGTLGGLGSSWVLLPVFYREESPISGDLILPLLTHGGVWIVVGAAGGLALGLGLGSFRLAFRAGLGGLLGAAIGATAFEAVGAFAFPNDETDQPVSKTWVTRLLLRLLISVLAATGAALAIQTRPRTKRLP
jgi:hypothetical protein